MLVNDKSAVVKVIVYSIQQAKIVTALLIFMSKIQVLQFTLVYMQQASTPIA